MVTGKREKCIPQDKIEFDATPQASQRGLTFKINVSDIKHNYCYNV
jgi:hypothetical protein